MDTASRFANHPVLLEVPYNDKDEAKRLGARWDAMNRLWFIRNERDLDRFSKWIPSAGYTPCWASSWYLAETTRRCHNCDTQTSVIGVLLPKGAILREDTGDLVIRDSVFATNILWLDKLVADALVRRNNTYRRDYSKTEDISYWMNHCSKCGAKQGDFYLYSDTEAFCLMQSEDAVRIALTRVDAHFLGHASGVIGADFLEV